MRVVWQTIARVGGNPLGAARITALPVSAGRDYMPGHSFEVPYKPTGERADVGLIAVHYNQSQCTRDDWGFTSGVHITPKQQYIFIMKN